MFIEVFLVTETEGGHGVEAAFSTKEKAEIYVLQESGETDIDEAWSYSIDGMEVR